MQIGSRRQAGSAGGVDCRPNVGRDFGDGFCAPVWLSDYFRSWGQLQLFIRELTSSSGSGAKPAEETELSNYQCLRVVVEDTVLVPAHSEMITAAKVLDKCDEGLAILEPTLDFVQRSKLLVGRSLVKMEGLIPILFSTPRHIQGGSTKTLWQRFAIVV